MKKYAHATLVVVDEFETKLKRSLSYYLSVMLMDKCDNSTISSFLGYSNVLGLDMDTNLSSPYDAYFQEAARTYNVPVALLLAICKTESDFNPNVVSGAGAIGLCRKRRLPLEYPILMIRTRILWAAPNSSASW